MMQDDNGQNFSVNKFPDSLNNSIFTPLGRFVNRQRELSGPNRTKLQLWEQPRFHFNNSVFFWKNRKYLGFGQLVRKLSKQENMWQVFVSFCYFLDKSARTLSALPICLVCNVKSTAPRCTSEIRLSVYASVIMRKKRINGFHYAPLASLWWAIVRRPRCRAD